MKISKTILSGAMFIALIEFIAISGCKKEETKRCGHCKTTCYPVGSSPFTTNGPTICDGDAGVTYAYDNAKNDCEASTTYLCSANWIEE